MGLLKFKQPTELFEPGLWTRVGVSKPAGASVGNCGAFCANRGACSPNKEIRTTVGLRIMSLASLESFRAGCRVRPCLAHAERARAHLRSVVVSVNPGQEVVDDKVSHCAAEPFAGILI